MKATSEALDWLENYLGHEPEAQEARRAARAEVEATERRLAALEGFVSGFVVAATRVEATCGAELDTRKWLARAQAALEGRSVKSVQRGEDMVRVYELWMRNPDGSTTSRLECAECGHVFRQSEEGK